MLSRIGLGTAQFGSAYGISNRKGKPSEAEIGRILNRALELGIRFIDTAPAYGDAEELIGKLLPSGHGMRIITKVAPGDDPVASAERSLERLNIEKLDALLSHGGNALGDLAKVKELGLASRVGGSVYDSDHAFAFALDVVQMPFNILDRRLANWLKWLSGNVAVHIRSVFLQGMLLMEPEELPEPVRSALRSLRVRWHLLKLTPIEACLSYVLSHTDAEAIIVGVNSVAELEEIAAAAQNPVTTSYSSLPTVDFTHLDPRRWPCAAS